MGQDLLETFSSAGWVCVAGDEAPLAQTSDVVVEVHSEMTELLSSGVTGPPGQTRTWFLSVISGGGPVLQRCVLTLSRLLH